MKNVDCHGWFKAQGTESGVELLSIRHAQNSAERQNFN